MKRVTLTAFMVCAAWLSFGQTARLGDLNRNSVVVTSALPQSVVSVNGQTGAVEITADGLGAATTQQVAAALAPMATTGYVAQASLADADGYTTQMVMRVGSEITTNRWGPSVTLPEGIVTNGMGGMTATTNSAGVPYVRFSGKGGLWGNAVTMGGSLFFDDWGSRIIFADGSGLDMSSMYFAAGTGGFKYWNGAAQAYSLRFDFGNVSVPYGNLTIAGTNTAAVVSSQSGYLMPHLGTNTTIQLIFTNGTLQAWEVAQ